MLPELLLVLCGTLVGAKNFVEIRRALDDPDARLHGRFDATDGDQRRVELRRYRVSHDMGRLNAARRYPGAPSLLDVRVIAMAQSRTRFTTPA